MVEIVRIGAPLTMIVDGIRHPIHYYIHFVSRSRAAPSIEGIVERDLIDDPWVQRLRRIRQLHCTWAAYPGGDHSRFLHSIGTMYLAGEFARKVYDPYFNEYKDRLGFPLPEIEQVVELFRIAGLLHDVGMGPFGHLFDEVYNKPNHQKTHNEISQDIVKNKLGDKIQAIRQNPKGKFSNPINPAAVSYLIKPNKEDEKQLKTDEIFPIIAREGLNLGKILKGLYGADTMDSILLDSYYCGVPEYGQIDYRRLVDYTRLDPKFGIVLDRGARLALCQFLKVRIGTYQTVYYHKTARAMEIAVEEALKETIENGEFEERFKLEKPLNLEQYFELDDHTLKAEMTQIKGELGEKWKKIYNRQIEWREVYASDITFTDPQDVGKVAKYEKEHLEDKLLNYLSKNIPYVIDMVGLDVREENPFIQEPVGMTATLSDGTPWGLSEYLRAFPLRLLFLRIFTKTKYYDQVKSAAEKAFKGIDE